MKKTVLKANERKEVGRKVKAVRKAGNIPATVYGKEIKSSSLSINKEEFLKIYAEAGETQLVELTVGSHIHPVLIHVVQKHPLSGDILHVEFHEVNLKEKVKAKIPLVFIGIAKAIEEKKGILLTLIDEVEVEALPADLPEKFEVNIESLAEVGDEILVSKINFGKNTNVLTDPGISVVKIAALAKEEIVIKPVVAEETTETPKESTESGEAPAEESKTDVEKEEK
jgi:large subunit ribosomal protein L25